MCYSQSLPIIAKKGVSGEECVSIFHGKLFQEKVLKYENLMVLALNKHFSHHKKNPLMSPAALISNTSHSSLKQSLLKQRDIKQHRIYSFIKLMIRI